MINVSREFVETMKKRTDFRENAEITLADGTMLTLAERDFTVTNNTITDGAGCTGIPLGEAVEKSVQIEVMNDDDHLSVYDFAGARVKLYLTFHLSSSVERINYGTYTVVTPETYGQTVIITAVDDMYKTDRPYHTSIPFPATIRDMLTDICTTLGIPLMSSRFRNDDFVVDSRPEGNFTFRQAVGYIAMIAGGNARINRSGYMEILTYNFPVLDRITEFNGGRFSPWDNGADLDGGDFSPWGDGDVADGGDFAELSQYHVLYEWKSLKVDTDDVIITGISTTVRREGVEDTVVTVGTDGYVLAVENPLIYGREKEGISLISAVMTGGKFRQFQGDHISYPLAEFMDCAAVVDRKGNTYATVITDIDFSFLGITTLGNSAEPAIRNSSRYYSEATELYRKAGMLVNEERTARETAVKSLFDALSDSSGLYITTEDQSDGSAVYYMHNKKILEESDIVWKLTAEAIGISTDGGVTYPYGFTVTGELITRLLYAVGINADYISTGAITVRDSSGSTIFVADMDTGQVMLSGESVVIGNSTAAQEIADKVSMGDVSSQVSSETGDITIRSNRLTIESDNFNLKKNGEVSANGTFTSSDIYGGQSVIGGAGLKIMRDGVELGRVATGSVLGIQGLGIQGKKLLTINDGESVGYIYNPSGAVSNYPEKHIFNGNTRFLSGICWSNSTRIGAGHTTVNGNSEDGTYIGGSLYVEGSLMCNGSKNRAVKTENYGTVLMNAIESAGAYFSDTGSGKIVSEGCCIIPLDEKFLETTESGTGYQIFITATCDRRTSHVKKSEKSFAVFGENGAEFDWMILARQKGYGSVRMEEVQLNEQKPIQTLDRAMSRMP